MSAPALRPEIAKGGGNEGISRESDEIVEKGPEAVDPEAVVASAGGLCGSQRTRRWRGVDSNFQFRHSHRVAQTGLCETDQCTTVSKGLNGFRRSPHFRQGHR
jgi:hypothetical protein